MKIGDKIHTIKKLIKEYAGTEFYFLTNFLDGGYENYVSENLNKIVRKMVFGKSLIKPEYKKVPNFQLEQKINEICYDTISYINNCCDGMQNR